jgi:hypothetical protein
LQNKLPEMTRNTARLAALVAFVSMGFVWCACQSPKTFESPAGYAFSTPERFVLPEKLNEISGIAIKPGNVDVLMAVEDETGKLYEFVFGNPSLTTSKFAKSGDYEDLALLPNGKVAVLISNGKIAQFGSMPPVVQDSTKTYTPALPQGEYEAVFAHGDTVFTTCKNCASTAGTLQIYKFQLPDYNYSPTIETVTVPLEALPKKTQKQLGKLETAAMAIHPLTKDWFLISSTKKQLVILNPDFSFKAMYTLDPTVFRQPEGMAFNSKGDLFVSNEGGTGKADLLRFNYQP